MARSSTNLLKRYPVASFYVLAFAISWLGWAPQVAASHGVSLFRSPYFLPLLILPGIGPALAAVIVARALEGKEGSRRLLASLFQWRIGGLWYALALGGPLVLFACTLGLERLFQGGALALREL